MSALVPRRETAGRALVLRLLWARGVRRVAGRPGVRVVAVAATLAGPRAVLRLSGALSVLGLRPMLSGPLVVTAALLVVAGLAVVRLGQPQVSRRRVRASGGEHDETGYEEHGGQARSHAGGP